MVFKKGNKAWSSGLTKEQHPSIMILSQQKIGEKNPHWFGDEVGYHGIHSWVRRNKFKPILCERCKKNSPYDLANISGEYKRDLNDYEWLCRRCHMIKDKRLDNFKKIPHPFGSNHSQAKLNEEKVKEVKFLLSIKETQEAIAKKFNISRSTIADINKGKTWNHVIIQKEVMQKNVIC